MSSTREPGYYWVKHDSEWVIAIYSVYKKWNSVAAGVFIGLDDYHLGEIDERRIERQAPESFDNTALRELLKKGLELLDKEQVVVIDAPDLAPHLTFDFNCPKCGYDDSHVD